MSDDVRRSLGRRWDPRSSNTSDYRVVHDPDSAAAVSTTVIHALADVMGVDVTDAGFVLYDSVDPDALDRIFAETVDGNSRSPGHVAFLARDHRVTVYGSGQIVITPPGAGGRIDRPPDDGERDPDGGAG